MRDLLGTIYDDQLFEALFPPQGQPALARLSPGPSQHHAVCAISLSDRQAAEAVRIRIDWTYALHVELSHPGFDFSVLCEFRARLLSGHAEQLLFETMRHALESLAVVAPAWLLQQARPAWKERYEQRIQEYRLPESRADR